MSNWRESEYFTTAYRSYERQNPVGKLDHYLDVVDARCQTWRSLNLLDIGCGPGAFLSRVHRRHPDWYLHGIDTDAAAVAECRRRVEGSEILLGSAAEASYSANVFDVITAWDVLEHVSSLETARQSISRSLRSGGLFAFVVPVYDGITGPLIRLLDKDETHLHKRSRGWWLDWASQSFRSLEWHGILRYLLLGGTYLHLPTHRLRNHTPAILVTGLNP